MRGVEGPPGRDPAERAGVRRGTSPLLWAVRTLAPVRTGGQRGAPTSGSPPLAWCGERVRRRKVKASGLAPDARPRLTRPLGPLLAGHLFYKFGITESDWYRIKQSIDSKCRTAWRRKQRGQSLAVKSFSRRTPSSSSYGASGRCGRGRGRPGLPGSVSPEGTLGSAEGTLGLSRGCARTTEGAALSEEPAGASLSLSPFARRPQASWGECWGAMLSCTMTGPGAFFPALSGGLVFPGEVHQEWQ